MANYPSEHAKTHLLAGLGIVDQIFDDDQAHVHRIIGLNTAVGSASEEDIWNAGGDYTGFLTTAATLRVRAGGNAADTSAGAGARTIEVEYLDSNWDIQTETLTLAGASASAATTGTAIRLREARVASVGTYGVANTGVIDIETSGGVLVGEIPADAGTTEKAIYTVPRGKVAYLLDAFLQLGSTTDATVRGRFRINANDVATPFSGAREFVHWDQIDYRTPGSLEFKEALKFDAYTDVWFSAIGISGTARVSLYAEFLELNA